MTKIRSKFKKINHYIQENIFIILTIITCIFLLKTNFDNDTYWLINTGKYIINNGFPLHDPFTIHEGLKSIIQQWLSTIIFYLTYEYFGRIGLMVLLTLCYMLLSYILYKTCVLVSDGNRYISIFVVFFLTLFLSFFIALRPQIFSYIIFSSEIYLLESYVKTKKNNLLFFSPLLSVLLINIHSAVWLLFFIFFIPYIIEYIIYKKLKKDIFKLKPLAIIYILSALVGLINPYGYNSLLYLFKSVNKSLYNISEMMSPDFKCIFGIIIFIIIIIIAISYIKYNKNIKIRYSLLTIGTLYMSLSSIRNLSLFVIISIPLVLNQIKHIKKENQNKFKIPAIFYVVCFCIIFGLFKYSFIKSNNTFETYYTPSKAVNYIKKNLPPDRIKLFNNFETGGYIEYNGIKPFIDSRAELFLKSINNKSDILIYYQKIISGRIHYNDLNKNFKITHFLINKDSLLYIYIKKDPAYKIIYEDKLFVIFSVNTK